MISREAIENAYVAACLAEIDALKPGNVHRFADGHRMTVEDFLVSARVSAPAIADPSLSTGRRVLAAVRATRQAVGTNTNLGIILLCAPLASAAALEDRNLRNTVARILASMDIEDTKAIFEAIVLASPGGLGSASSHDVREEPRTTIVEAMREAADRDMIACQYATNFRDIFDTGLKAYDEAEDRGERDMWPTVFTYLAFLAAFPDSHMARKHGVDVAERVKAEAKIIRSQIAESQDTARRTRILLDFDAHLKSDGLNPGTSADLTVATLFAHSLKVQLA